MIKQFIYRSNYSYDQMLKFHEKMFCQFHNEIQTNRRSIIQHQNQNIIFKSKIKSFSTKFNDKYRKYHIDKFFYQIINCRNIYRNRIIIIHVFAINVVVVESLTFSK